MKNNKRVYFDNLDGLRFLCFLSVFFYHSFHTNYTYISDSPIYTFLTKTVFGNGNLGVNFFFVLSGFLITYLLIEEKRANGQINLKKFWMRRILRIWPLFYFCIFFGFYAFPFLKSMLSSAVPEETANIGYYLVFLNNFDMINNGLPDASILGVLWSVAIEEQFYLVWPIILFFLPIKKYWMAFVTIIGISLIFRGLYDTNTMHETHTLSCIGDMAIGSFGAWLIIENNKFKEYFVNLSKSKILSIYILFFLIFFFRDEVLFSNYYIRIFERSFIAIVILFVILEQNYSLNSFFKMSNFKRISKLGLITYGLYCLHFIGILITITITNKLMINTHLWQVVLIDTSIALIISIIIAKISFKYYEKPFLRLKEKFSF